MSNRPMKKNHSERGFGQPVDKPAFPNRRTGCARLAQHALPTTARPKRSLKLFFGWRGGGMASLYTREANRTKLARDTAVMLLPERDRTFIPSPLGRVRARGQIK
jgi:hypothetical protein